MNKVMDYIVVFLMIMVIVLFIQLKRQGELMVKLSKCCAALAEAQVETTKSVNMLSEVDGVILKTIDVITTYHKNEKLTKGGGGDYAL